MILSLTWIVRCQRRPDSQHLLTNLGDNTDLDAGARRIDLPRPLLTSGQKG